MNRIFRLFVIISLAGILIIIMTFPLAFNFNKYIPGFFSTDESYAVLWNAWLMKYSIFHNVSIKKTDFIAYPFGVDFYTNKPIGYIWFGINYVLARFTTPVLTYNAQVFLNLFLTFFISFFLMRYLTENIFCGFFSGLSLAFCPYLFVRYWQHLGDTYFWTVPFVLLMLFIIKDNPRGVLHKILFIFGFIFATSLGFNFLYIGIALMAFFIYFFLTQLKDKAIFLKENKIFFKNAIILCLIGFILLLPQTYPVVKGVINSRHSVPSAQNPYLRPFEDLFAQSAKPLSYFLPAIVHPLFGKFTERFIGTQLYGESVTEHTLYLGWTPLILAFFAFRRWRKRKIGTVPCGDSPFTLLKTHG